MQIKDHDTDVVADTVEGIGNAGEVLSDQQEIKPESEVLYEDVVEESRVKDLVDENNYEVSESI